MCKTENRNSQLEHGQLMEQCFARATRVWVAVNHNTSVTSGEFNVRSVLHGQLSLAAFNQICVIHEAMTGYKNRKIH